MALLYLFISMALAIGTSYNSYLSYDLIFEHSFEADLQKTLAAISSSAFQILVNSCSLE